MADLQTEILINQSKLILDEKIFLFIIHLQDLKIRKMLVEALMGIENPTFHTGL